MPTISAAQQQTIPLEEGRALTLSGAPGAVGIVYRLDQALGGTNSLQSWAIGSGSVAPLGPFPSAEKFLITCSVGSVTATVVNATLTSPGVVTDNFGSVTGLKGLGGGGGRFATSILRNEALVKHWGCSGANGLLQTSGQSGSAWSMCVKMEMEAPFHAVRLLRVNRSGLNALGGGKALVFVTESNAIDASYGLTLSQNLSRPVYNVGGTATAYNAIAPAGTVNGYQNVNWPGREVVALTNATTTATVTTKVPHGLVTANTVTVRDADLAAYNVTAAAITVLNTTQFTYPMATDPGAAATAMGTYTANACGTLKPNLNQTFALSEKSPMKSRPTRLDGGSRPLLGLIFWHDGTAQSFPFHNVSIAVRGPTAAMRGRTVQVGAILADAVGNLGWNFSLDTVLMDVFPVVSFSVPVLSIWGVGDSTWQNDGLTATKMSSWLYRACMDVSTPTAPVVYANFGASSQSSATYWAQAKGALAAGTPPPSVLWIGLDSVNDGVNNDGTLQSAFALAQDVIATAKKYGIPVVVMSPRMPNNTLNAAQYAIKVAQDAALAALAAAYGIQWVPFTGLGDGAVPERWLPSAGQYAATSFTGSIAGTLLTVSSLATASAPVTPGQQIFGAGVTAGTTIVGYGGSAGTFIVSPSQTVSSTAMSSLATCNISTGAPAVVSIANAVVAGQSCMFTSTVALPEGIPSGTQLFVAANPAPTTTTFSVSLTPDGPAITATVAGIGVHSVFFGRDGIHENESTIEAALAPQGATFIRSLAVA
ncbi:hypothetical protein [Massilia pseudoviolaceinigra]|uniref:hypothetical protein n=1 Tax=Massilia pseudoviolaceinigra TaxID=3057165 RepID=UPI002796C684|nr:hypothetical protein [Massilia sp. CCM 9206]MDQ1921632.1 hypothetical protein [Massilia sp. CCM 9206]